jgi:hypothetical protein
MAPKDIYVELTREWGGFAIGDVVRFGLNKGLARIEAGGGRKVRKQRAVNDIAPPVKRPPVVETVLAPPAGERADLPPDILSPPPNKRIQAAGGASLDESNEAEPPAESDGLR